jgi:hypothetical protein
MPSEGRADRDIPPEKETHGCKNPSSDDGERARRYLPNSAEERVGDVLGLCITPHAGGTVHWGRHHREPPGTKEGGTTCDNFHEVAIQVPLLSRDSFPRGLPRTPEESGKRPGGRDRSGTQPSHRGPRGEPATTINAVNHGDANLPRASTNIEEKEFIALIDTGATHNVIRQGAAAGQVKLLDQPAQLQTTTAHGQVRIKGTVTNPFVVAPDLHVITV